MRIHQAQDDCKSDMPGTGAWLQCDSDAIDAYDDLLPKTKSHPDLIRLFDMLSEPMEYTMAGEEAATARKTVLGSYADLAHARVIVLTGAPAPSPDRAVGRLDPGPRLGWMSDRRLAAEADKLWVSIRDRDCRAYPVPRCADRLDALFRDLIDGPVISARRMRTEGW